MKPVTGSLLYFMIEKFVWVKAVQAVKKKPTKNPNLLTNNIELGDKFGSVLEATADNVWYLFHEETKQQVLKTVTVTRQL